MKTNELMIGDWVLEGGQYPHKIECLGDQIDGMLPECYSPIPLTPEILKKNGFKDTDIVVLGTRKFHWRSEDERTEITIWFFDDTMPMEIVKNVYYEDEVSYTLPFPWSVNMLQNALRICGIDKEIVI